VVSAYVVRDGPAAGANASTDKRTLAAPRDAANDCSAHSRAADDLGARMVAVVTAGLSALCVLMRGLCSGAEWREQGE
jgi:hypothetical protein